MAIDITDKISQGVELMALERYEAAKAVFEEVINADRRNLDAYLHLGNAYMNLDEVDNGIAQFKKALVIDENSTNALYSLGCAYFLKGDYANSMKHFNRVEALGVATVEMYMIMMTMFVDSDDPAMAIRSVNRAIQLSPLNSSLRVEKAQIYVALGHYQEAVATVHELQEILPDEAEGYAVEIEVQLEAENYDAAIEAADRALDRFPNDPTLHLLKARVLNTVGRYEEALEASRLALVGNPGESDVKAEVAFQAGVALGGMGRFEDSIRTIENSIGEGREASEAYYLIMTEATGLGIYDKAAEYADKLLALGVDEMEPRVRAAAIFTKPFAYDKLGRVEEAQALFKEAATALRRITIANPGLFEVYSYRVMAHRELREYDEAIDLADHLISLDENDAAAYALKRTVLLAKGDEAGANEMRAKTLAIDPDFEFGEE